MHDESNGRCDTSGRFTATLTLEERFWQHVDRAGPEDCWEWTAGRWGAYGRFRVGRAGSPRLGSHVVAWQFANGRAVPPDMEVCHSCDNPPCCNPAHLFIGSGRDNAADRARKGRNADQWGERNGSSYITAERVAEVRRLYAAGNVTQAVLAQRFGMAQSHVSQMINHKARAHG